MGHKVVFNDCHGGFGLSRKACEALAEAGVQSAKDRLAEFDSPENESWARMGFTYHPELPRHDARLVKVVEELGDAASGSFAHLKVDEIEGARYRIDEYDGWECVQAPDDIKWTDIA